MKPVTALRFAGTAEAAASALFSMVTAGSAVTLVTSPSAVDISAESGSPVQIPDDEKGDVFGNGHNANSGYELGRAGGGLGNMISSFPPLFGQIWSCVNELAGHCLRGPALHCMGFVHPTISGTF
jgi:hypothetical protein